MDRLAGGEKTAYEYHTGLARDDTQSVTDRALFVLPSHYVSCRVGDHTTTFHVASRPLLFGNRDEHSIIFPAQAIVNSTLGSGEETALAFAGYSIRTDTPLRVRLTGSFGVLLRVLHHSTSSSAPGRVNGFDNAVFNAISPPD
jgi:hypothetical protein